MPKSVDFVRFKLQFYYKWQIKLIKTVVLIIYTILYSLKIYMVIFIKMYDEIEFEALIFYFY